MLVDELRQRDRIKRLEYVDFLEAICR